MAEANLSKTRKRRRHRWRWPLYVLGLLFAVVVGLYLYFTHPKRIAAMAQQTLARITGASVEIDSAEFEFDGPITLYGVHMRVPNVPGNPEGGDRLFDCESVVIEHRLAGLLTGGLDIQSVQFRRPIFYPTEHVDDGKFTLQYLKPEKRKKDKKKRDRSRDLPDIRIQGAHVVFGEIKDGAYQVLQSIRLDADVMRQSDIEDDYRFALTRNKIGDGQPLRLSGIFNLVENTLDAEVNLGEITPDDPRLKLMPHGVRELLTRLRPNGKLSLIKLGYSPDKKVTAELTLEDGSLLVPWGDTDLPVDQTQGTLTISENERVTLNLKGRAKGSGYDAAYTIAGTVEGLNPDAPFEASVTLAGKVSDRPEDMHLLPGPLRFLFQRYGPHGNYEIHANVARGTDGEEFIASGKLKLIDGSILYELLPYPLDNVTANVSFDMDHVVIDGIVGVGPADEFGNRARIRLDGAIVAPGRRSGVNVNIHIDGMPLNEDLFSALKPHERKALTSFFDQGAYVRLTAEQGGAIQSTRQQTRRKVLIADLESKVAALIDLGQEASFEMAEYQQRLIALRAMVQRPVFDLGGRTNLLIQLRRAPGEPKIKTTITSESAGVFAMYEHWPYPLKVTGGTVVLDTSLPRVDAMNLVAEGVGGGRFELNGQLLPPPEGARLMVPNIDINAIGMPVDDVLLAVIPDQYAHWLRDLQFNGQWNAKGRIETTKEDKITYGFDVTFKDATLRPWGGNYDLKSLTGGLRIDRSGLSIDAVKGRHGTSVLTFKAQTERPEEAGLTLSGENIRFDDPIIDLLPPDSEPAKELTKLFADHSPQGVFDFEVSQTRQADGSSAYRATLSPKMLAFKLNEQLFDLKDVTGQVIIDGKTVAFKGLSANFGAGQFDVNGSMSVGNAFSCELLFNIAADRICPIAKSILPSAVVSTIKAIELEGPYELKQASLSVNAATSEGKPLAFNAKLSLSKAKANIGVAITELTGMIDINVSQEKSADRPSVVLDVVDATLRAGDRRIESLNVKLHTTEKPGLVQISKLKGKSYGGTIIGEGFVQAGEKDSTYRLTLSLQDVELDPFLKPLDPKYLNFKASKDVNKTTQRERVAVLSASLSLEGKTGDPNSRRGRGNLSVTDATLYETPVGFAVLQLLNLSLPSAKSFDGLRGTYLIDGDDVQFDKLEFYSKALKITGSGTMKYSTLELDLTLVSVNPNGIDLGPLTDVLNLLKDELISLRVTGTLKDPKAGVQSLKGLRKSVDDVLGEPKKEKTDSGAKVIQPEK